MKKAIVCGLWIIILGTLGIVIALWMKKADPQSEDIRSMPYKERGAYLLTKRYPTDVIWFGEYSELEYAINVRFPGTISRDSIKKEENCSKAMIVINDYSSETGVTKDDIDLIFEILSTDSRYIFFYMGRKNLAYIGEVFDQSKNDGTKCGIDPDYCTDVIVVHYNGEWKLVSGGQLDEIVGRGMNLSEEVYGAMDTCCTLFWGY